MNGDGRDDVVGDGTSLTAMCTAPAGGYGPVITLTPAVSGGGGIGPSVVADFNNDGVADILASTFGTGPLFTQPYPPPTTFLYPGVGNCTVGPAIPVPDPAWLSSWGHRCFLNPFVPGLTGPGVPPVVVLISYQGFSSSPHLIHTLTYAGGAYTLAATAQAPLPPPLAGSLGFSLELAGDFNGDGLLDLLGRASTFTWNVVCMFGTAQPPYFAAPVAVLLSFPPANLAFDAADVDNDGLSDLVVVSTSGQVVTCHGHPTAPFTNLTTSTIGAQIQSFFVHDLDGDGAPDFFFRTSPSSGATTLAFSRGNGAGGFGSPMILPWSLSLQNDCAGPVDENGDGLKDVLASFLGTGGTTFVLRNQSKIGPGVPGLNAVIPQTVVGIANAGSPFYFAGVVAGSANSPAALGVSLGILPAPDSFGNMLDLSPGMLLLPSGGLGIFQTNAAGSVAWIVSLPPAPALVGQTVYLEWAVQDPAAVNGYAITPARKVLFW